MFNTEYPQGGTYQKSEGGRGLLFSAGMTGGESTMTFSTTVHEVTANKKGEWSARVELGDGYWLEVQYQNGELSVRGNKSIRNEPTGYDTILEQVEDILGEAKVPDVETDGYGAIESIETRD